jgi:hypothetical protein
MRRLLALSVVAVGALTLAGAVLVPAGAGNGAGGAPLTIEKEVDGQVPEDTEFTVRVTCDDGRGGGIIFNHGGPLLNSVTVDFDEDGDPDDPNTITFGATGTCTVIETEDGDAEEVSYECEGQFPVAPGSTGFDEGPTPQQDQVADPCGGVHGPTEDPITVFIENGDQSATVTVTNEFPDPEKPAPVAAAQPVTVSPTFTG